MSYLTFILLTLLALVSCGKGSNGQQSSRRPTVVSPLSSEEEALAQKLITKEEWDQQELTRLLSTSPGVSEETFGKLDQKLNINCSADEGTCLISFKEIP